MYIQAQPYCVMYNKVNDEVKYERERHVPKEVSCVGNYNMMKMSKKKTKDLSLIK